MKRVAVLAGLAFVLLAAGAGLTWMVGQRTEAWFRDNVTPATDATGPWRVTLTRYERGWFRSTAESRVELRTDATVYADVDHVIDHLPLPGKGWARVHSSPRWPEKVQAAADYYFENQPGLSVETEVGLGGSTIRLVSPPFRKAMLGFPDVQVTWGGASAALRMPEQDHIVVDAQIPQLAFADGAKSIDVANVTLDGDWTVATDASDWQGGSRLAAASIRLANDGSGGVLRDLETAVQQRRNGETLTIGYRAGVAAGEIDDAGGQATKFSNARIEIELDRISRSALRLYYDRVASLAETNTAGDEAAQLATAMAMQTAGDFLAASPVFRIKTLGLQTSAGDLTGSAELSFDGEGFQRDLPLPLLLGKVRFDANLEVSRPLLRSWLSQAQAAAEIDRQLAAFAEAGLIRTRSDKYATTIQLAQGALRVNGLPADELLGTFFH